MQDGLRTWLRDFATLFKLNLKEKGFLLCLYAVSVGLRLIPRLRIDPHLLPFMGDVWYRLCMGQFILDHHSLPEPDIRYVPYGYVPMWYPPLSPILLAVGSWLTRLDLPTFCSRVLPFFEALSPLTLYFVGRHLYGKWTATIATAVLALTPNFVYFTGIADTQSFTLFVAPIAILLLIIQSERPNKLNVLFLGILLALDFLIHLSYFLLVLTLLAVSIALVLSKKATKSLFLDYLIAVVISQAITAPWWLPRNLYWWWIRSLVTSSGLYPLTYQLQYYGLFAAVFGIVAMVYLLRSPRRHLALLLWALPSAIETQNEVILSALHLGHLTWETLAKPLEGYRFFPFLAQPASLAIGAFLTGLARDASRLRVSRRTFLVVASLLMIFGQSVNLVSYNLPSRLQNSGLLMGEYEAAVWFRENTGDSARICADYYRAQMFSGVCGGKALLGGMFPLRNVDYPYIRAPGQVQNDLYILYNASEPEVAWNIANQYNLTHVFYSTNQNLYGNLLSSYKPAYDFGVDTDVKKFQEERYFEVVYRKDALFGEVVIVEVKR